MTYRCPNCKEPRESDICSVCGLMTEYLGEDQSGAVSSPAVPPPPPPPPATDSPSPATDSSAPATDSILLGQAPALSEMERDLGMSVASAPVAEVVDIGAPLANAAPDDGGWRTEAGGSPLIPQAGQEQLAQYVEDGYEVYLIAGIAAAGKSQLLDAYRRDAFLSSFVKRDGLALPTSPDRLDCHPVSMGRRKIVFVDTSGEHFKRLYPHLTPTGEITESEIDFLRLISRRLSGLVLLVDLQRLWAPRSRTNPEHEAQVDILTWVLILLRWLKQSGAQQRPAGSGRLGLRDQVNRDVMRQRRRLKPPVLVLFSRADELVDMPIPASPGQSFSERTLFPVGENPLLLAHHLLPQLVRMLETHVDHFRFDFVHSLVTDGDTGEIVDDQACGATLSLAWLLDSAWRWPAIPTRYWLRWQRFIDRGLRRDDRWHRLPDAEDLDG